MSPGKRSGAPHSMGAGLLADRPAGNLDLVVLTPGHLPIPPEVAHRLDLLPGDLVALEQGPASLRLLPLRELLRDKAREPLAAQVDAVARFARHEVTAMGLGGTLPIPAEVFPLPAGEPVVLQVQDRGSGFRLFLFKDDPPAGEDVGEPGAGG